MKLKNVKVENFRSISSIDFKFDPTCRVLVGINESGKSNILKALSMLDNNSIPTPSDMRELSDADEEAKEYSVRFIFEFDSTELENFYNSIKKKIYNLNKNEEVVVTVSGEKLSLKKLSSKYNKGVYYVDIEKAEKQGRYYSVPSLKLLPFIKKITDQCPVDFTLKNNQDEDIKIGDYKLINIGDFGQIPDGYVEDANFKDLEVLFSSMICDYIKENLPETLFWNYSENNILPPKINIAEFKENPNICLPLKHMFLLANVDNIESAIDNAQQTEKGFKNLLNRIAKKSTSHLHSVWKEHKKIQFELLPNGENIDASIKDEYNSFDFAQRSDGFKRFVSFLLMVSTKVKSDLLDNALLLIDEPDSGLHPAGARFLRNELIKISKKNYVVYSSHSIFMIDRKNIPRHFIVEKDKEVTSIKDANESNIVKEEVIYNALGFSFFETLKEKNIIFEGWKDEVLFENATTKIPRNYAHLKAKLKDMGTCYGYGVKSMSQITPLLKLASRHAFIVSDSDAIAKQKKKEYENNNGYGIWLTYDDIDPMLQAVTGEDFIKLDVLVKILNEIKTEKNYTNAIDINNFLHIKGRLNVVDQWLIDNGVKDKQTKKIVVEDFKNRIFENLKNTHIEEYYYSFLEKLLDTLDGVPSE